MYCTQCGRECEVIEIDVGVGYTERGSHAAVHSLLVVVSDCCESPCADEDGEPVNQTEPDFPFED